MPFETFDIYSAGYCLLRGHIPRCVPAPGNRYKFVFTDSARAVAADFDLTDFIADHCPHGPLTANLGQWVTPHDRGWTCCGLRR